MDSSAEFVDRDLLAVAQLTDCWGVMVGDKAGADDPQVEVNSRVRVYPGTDAETHGVVVEDFGEMPAASVDIGDNHFADPARRWAVLLDAGTLVFTDTDQLVPE